jgi:hypothetical protein
VIDELVSFNFDQDIAVIWNAKVRTATIYPEGVANEQKCFRFVVPFSDNDVTQDELCAVLNAAYDDNLKNPSGHTAKLWKDSKLISTAEEEIERHLKGQIALYFAGKSRPIRVLCQTNTAAGRTDLILLQKSQLGGPRLNGVVELKVLRGPSNSDRGVVTEGLSQGFHYREEMQLPFSTLALYDVKSPPSDDVKALLIDQNPLHT